MYHRSAQLLLKLLLPQNVDVLKVDTQDECLSSLMKGELKLLTTVDRIP